jgi:mycofactocin precursor
MRARRGCPATAGDALEGSMEEANPTATSVSEPGTADERDLVEEELLVEEVSIDGMCGVY